MFLTHLGVQAGSLDERNASFLLHQIRTNKSEIYGDGFRYQNLGLEALLEHVAQSKTLPSSAPRS